MLFNRQYVIIILLIGIIGILLFRDNIPVVINTIGRKFGPKFGGRYDIIYDLCGELCDVTKPIHPTGGILGTVTAKVNCPDLFASDEIDRPSDHKPLPWEEIPEDLQNQFSHNGQVDLAPWYLDDMDVSAHKEEIVFTEEDVNNHVQKFQEGTPLDPYGGCSDMVNKAADFTGVEGKTVLVIGSLSPWLEAVLLTKNPKKIITLEYGSFRSEHPKWDYIQPNKFRQMYEDNELPVFDRVFTYSSLEHSGLGRYGDALNPWGDIITVARVTCVCAPDAKFAIGVPTHSNDTLVFNAHRIFGPILYPYMMTNWKLVWTSDDAHVKGQLVGSSDGVYQPMYVFERNL